MAMATTRSGTIMVSVLIGTTTDRRIIASTTTMGTVAASIRYGLVDRSILRSHKGVKAVAPLAIFALSGSVALLADLIHNFGDALTCRAAGDRVLSSERPG
jgi:hypothetical protein